MTQNGELDTIAGGTAAGGFTSIADALSEWDDGPWTVNGVALGEGDITQGVSGKRVYWPAETLETAAESLVGKKIVDDRDHDDLDRSQPAVETIIGEVTAAKYQPGVGITYQGEIDDPDTAKQVERGRIDVSPMLYRRTGAYDEDRDAYTAEAIVKWRDLATVAEGASEGASIRPGAATALQAEALRESFGDTGDDSDEKTQESATDSETDSEETKGAEPPVDNEDAPDTMDLTDDEEALVHAARSIDGDDPVVVPAATKDLAKSADELAINDVDDPKVVDRSDYEKQRDAIGQMNDLLTDTLVEQGETKASEAAAMSFTEKFDEFADEEGTIDAEALVQSPEAGGAGGSDDDEEGGGSTNVDLDALSDDERSEITSLAARAETFDSIDAGHAESLREEAAGLAGVDEFADIELEVL